MKNPQEKQPKVVRHISPADAGKPERVHRVETDPEIIRLNEQLAELQNRQREIRQSRSAIRRSHRANGGARRTKRIARVAEWLLLSDENMLAAAAVWKQYGLAISVADRALLDSKIEEVRNAPKPQSRKQAS